MFLLLLFAMNFDIADAMKINEKNVIAVPRDEIKIISTGNDDVSETKIIKIKPLLPKQPIHQLGGHPFFSQEDSRVFEEDIQADNQLVLQIDTDDDERVEIAWHDDGISNILMISEDLKAMNFDKYIYTWDTL